MKNNKTIVKSITTNDTKKDNSTIDPMVYSNQKQIFGTADLWNIHKQVRTAFTRRRVF